MMPSSVDGVALTMPLSFQEGASLMPSLVEGGGASMIPLLAWGACR
jgi:hypothetical protein